MGEGEGRRGNGGKKGGGQEVGVFADYILS
jgi:hypothetical protein